MQIQNYEDAISIEAKPILEDFEVFELENGDKVVGSSSEAPHQFKDLMAYDTIFNSYITATNELLNLNRDI